jgi:hypothetical protein
MRWKPLAARAARLLFGSHDTQGAATFMSRAVKTFTVSEEEVENIPFDLEFLPADPEKDRRVEHFEAYGKAPAGAMNAALRVSRRRGRRSDTPDSEALMEFFALSMPPEDYDRLEALVNSPEWMLDFSLLANIFGWLLEEQAERPTRRSRRSSRTGPDDGRTVLAVESVPVEPSGANSSS